MQYYILVLSRTTIFNSSIHSWLTRGVDRKHMYITHKLPNIAFTLKYLKADNLSVNFVCIFFIHVWLNFHLHKSMRNMNNSVLQEYQTLLLYYTYKCLNHIHSIFSHFLYVFKDINGVIFPCPFFQSIKSYICTCPTNTSTVQGEKTFMEINLCQGEEIIFLELLFCFSESLLNQSDISGRDSIIE